MEETSYGKIEVILRLRQVMEDFQRVRRELREVLGIMATWDGSGVAAASRLGWPHGDSLKGAIRRWLGETVRPEGENQPELSRVFIDGGEELRAGARHVLDGFWLVSIRRADRHQDGEAGDGEGELTAVAIVRASSEAETPSTGGQDQGGDAGERQEVPAGDWPRYRQGEDEYGKLERAGMPPGAHGVEDLVDMYENLEAMKRVAGMLLEKGAPLAAGDYLYGWTAVEMDQDGWLWISYRPWYPGRRPAGK